MAGVDAFDLRYYSVCTKVSLIHWARFVLPYYTIYMATLVPCLIALWEYGDWIVRKVLQSVSSAKQSQSSGSYINSK